MASSFNAAQIALYDCVRDCVLLERCTDPEAIARHLEKYDVPLIAEMIAYILNRPRRSYAPDQPESSKSAAKRAAATPVPRRPHQRLTDEMRAQLLESGSCFYCRKQGHIALECPLRKGKAPAKRCRSPARSPARSRSPSPPSRFRTEADMSD